MIALTSTYPNRKGIKKSGIPQAPCVLATFLEGMKRGGGNTRSSPKARLGRGPRWPPGMLWGRGPPQVPLTAGPLKAPPSRARNKGAAPGARCARPGATSGERSRRPLTSRVSGEGCARPARLALHAAVSPALFFCYSELTSPTLRGRPMGGGGQPLISMPWNRPLRQRPGGGAWPGRDRKGRVRQ